MRSFAVGQVRENSTRRARIKVHLLCIFSLRADLSAPGYTVANARASERKRRSEPLEIIDLTGVEHVSDQLIRGSRTASAQL